MSRIDTVDAENGRAWVDGSRSAAEWRHLRDDEVFYVRLGIGTFSCGAFKFGARTLVRYLRDESLPNERIVELRSFGVRRDYD